MWLVSSRSSATGLPFVSYTATAKTVRLLAPLDDGVPSPTIGETFDIIESTIVVDAEHPLAPGEVLVKVLCMSVDPYLRGAIKSINGLTGEAKSSEPRVMEGFVAGTIVASNADEWIAGDRFGANLPFSTVQRAKLGRTIAWKLTDVVSEAEISLGLGIFGMPGATAYGGVTDILRPSTKPGAKEIIFVSGAAGAVGSMVGQIAKGVYGATVIGSTGGPEKVRTILSKYAFDFAIDHKALPKKAADGSWEERKAALLAKLKEVAPGGLDRMFSNVGQDHFEAGFESLRPRGRIAVCGQIAAYSDAAAKQPVPANLQKLAPFKLRDLCKRRGLSTGGDKKAMIARLEGTEAPPEPASAPAPASTALLVSAGPVADAASSLPANLEALQPFKLKAHLKERGLSQAGAKEALIQRLRVPGREPAPVRGGRTAISHCRFLPP